MIHLILPGYGDSGPAHWQSLWETADPAYRRVRQADWESPRRADWVATLERALAAEPEPAVLVAHSLACLLVAHWAAEPGASLSKVRAAFLAAPVDPGRPAFPASAQGFAPVPRRALPFPSLVVASSDDPYAGIDFARSCALDWGSRLAEVGARGHINSASGVGDWPEGRALLAALVPAT
jgi:predicted alpha/beta hydrolase family esterase